MILILGEKHKKNWESHKEKTEKTSYYNINNIII